MLNAFRHLRYLHLLAARNRVGESEVLNAFRHLRYLHSHSSTWTRPARSISAQRLSASEVSALAGRVDEFLPASVLNAFRHLRYLHQTRQLAAGRTPCLVLNAFRHLRYLHSRFSVCRPLICRCSTPFGI